MKLAIVTAVFGDGHRKLAELTLPTIRRYAEFLGAELVVLDEALKWGHPHWEKFQIADIITRVDRVAWIDIDAIINPKAESIFDFVPAGHFGALYDIPFYRMDYHGHIALTAELLGYDLTKWDWNYSNMGIFVCDASHSALFDRPRTLVKGGLPEQTYLSMRRSELGIPFFDIGPRFNQIRVHLCPPTAAQLRADIVHYAGWLGRRDTPDSVVTTFAQIKDDLAAWDVQ